MLRLLIAILLVSSFAAAQTRMVITGKVVDSRTGEPLSFATVGLKKGVEQTISKSDGTFQLLAGVDAVSDTLSVVYLGYLPWTRAVSLLTSVQIVELQETYTLLSEVVVTSRKFNARDVDRAVKPIRGKLYAMQSEVTNAQYNMFLAWLEDNNQQAKRKQFDYHLDQYDKVDAEYFKRYSAPSGVVTGKGNSSGETDDYPVVNVTWASAVAYCSWLTDQYNSHEKKKKFKKVVFRLPTRDEWQIAALGYDKFQSWTYDENFIETRMTDDTLAMLPRNGEKIRMSVQEDVLYPWWGAWHYRNRPQNHLNCWLGNFLVLESTKICPARNPAFDGWAMMGKVQSYFPNNIGLYDVVGNVAEMISEEGLACGGSWNDPPQESTIKSIKKYKAADKSVGFRVFMEVIEP